MKAKIPLKPSNSRFTDSQWLAVYETGNNILVSASAGSGKTTVLVERVIEKIYAGIDIDQLLIVTYTEAAAKEMKERIQIAIQTAIQKNSDGAERAHLVRQLSLLNTAAISTLHAFCLQVIQRYYYLIDLDPSFRMLTDETETLLLKEDVWADLREELYGEDRERFYQLTANFSSDRSDEGLTNLINRLYTFSRAHPEPEKWLAQLVTSYDLSLEDFTESDLYQQLLKPQLSGLLQDLAEQAKQAAEMSGGAEELVKQTALLQTEAENFANLSQMLMNDEVEMLWQAASDFIFARFPTTRGLEEELKELNQAVKERRDAYKKQWQTLAADYFQYDLAMSVRLMQQAAPLIQELAMVVSRFTDHYQEAKRQRGLLDFNDLEHLTLAILTKYNQRKKQFVATEASNYYREKFSEVLVDEYQDVNQLQEAIVFWLSKPTEEAGNLFMVGDVKQSIYGFRLADPTLFLTKYEAFGQQNGGERIILAENFRSRKEVLDFTNFIFMQLMDKKVGQMAYDEPAQLVNGFTQYPDLEQFQPEILIYESETDDGDEEEPEESVDYQIQDKTQGEITIVAQKIQQMITEEWPIFDKKTGETRPVDYGDIVLLTPTKKNHLVLLEIFKQYQIPLQVKDAQNYFQSTEIRIMMALLQVIDNPFQDIPLAALLRSPIVGLDENELVFLRIQKKTGDYYSAVKDFLTNYQVTETNPFAQKVYEKVKLFMDRLTEWRAFARQNQLVDLIWMIYEETAFLDYVGGMPAGKQRQANLHALYERAYAYEQTSFKGLFQFVRFIEKMQEKDKDLAEASAEETGENSVRVMTIHGSKGLEFPIVFVLDLAKKFNLTDIRQNYIFDEKFGAGIAYLEPEKRILYDTLPEIAIKKEKQRQLLSEEMRKLYVALTRAEEKLFLVASYKNADKAWESWQKAADMNEVVLSEAARLSAGSLMNWIGLSLVRHMQNNYDTPYPIVDVALIKNHPARFSLHFYKKMDLLAVEPIEETEAWLTELSAQLQGASDSSDQSMTQAVKILDYQYSDEIATKTTSYQSVSELKRLFEDPDTEQLTPLVFEKPKYRVSEQQLSQPKFLNVQEKEPTSMEIGTATHLVLQKITLLEPPSEASITTFIVELVEKKILTEKVAAMVKIATIIQFFSSDFGQWLLKHHDSVQREVPFAMVMKGQDIFAEIENDTDEVLIHGMMDGYAVTEDELILYDFKTDYVPQPFETGKDQIIERYKGQINLYGTALENMFQRKTTHRYLILLSTGDIIDLNP